MANRIEIHECDVENVGDSVKELWLGLAREMFEFEHLTLPSEANADTYVKSVREDLAEKQGFLLVAKSRSKLVGFIYATISSRPVEITRTIGSINDLYVLPEYRGRGMGRKLMAECLSKLKDAKVEVVYIRVLVENKIAISLYEKLGFKVYNYGMMKQL